MIEHSWLRYMHALHRKPVRAGTRLGEGFMLYAAVAAFMLFGHIIGVARSLAGQDEPAVLPPPVSSSKYFPCARCHQDGTASQSQGEHTYTTIHVKRHPGKKYDCFSCHDRSDRDRLRLFDGSQVKLEDSSQLCGQCHSTNYSLWQSRLHGKITGTWNGEKMILPCTSCHDPHDPVFAAQAPRPPPTPPENTLRWRK